MSKHSIYELQQMQSLSLSAKIAMTRTRIRGWYDEYNGQVYVSFSGGKDSTVLVDIVDKMGFKDIPLVFVDTGLEFPEIRDFVKTYGDRVTWVKPKQNFRQVIKKYGYPFISKDVSECVEGARKYVKQLKESGEISDSGSIDYEELARVLNDRMINRKGGANQRLAIMLGMLTNDTEEPIKANIDNDEKSLFTQDRYKFLLEAPFEISNKCCKVFKKEPAHRYTAETGRKPITAQMASESRLRTQKWLQYGCNQFDLTYPISNPMSFWTEQDVLLYIKQNNLPICPVYGEIVEDWDSTDDVKGQLTISDIAGYEDMGIFDAKRPPLKTTLCDRTGCAFCGFGCHIEKNSRFERLKQTHPKIYEWIMKPWDQGGLGYKEVIDWINENGNMNIRY